MSKDMSLKAIVSGPKPACSWKEHGRWSVCVCVCLYNVARDARRPMKVYITNSIIGVKRSRGCIGCVLVMSAFLSVRLRFPIKAAMHKGTLEMKLALVQFAKVFAHNQALYKPLQRQVSQAEVTRGAVKANVKVILPRPAWLTWCKQLAVQGTAPARADLKILKQGQAVRDAMSDRVAESRSQAARRSKTCTAPPLPKSLLSRRTPFRLRNISPVIRPGRKSKQI